LFWRIFLSEQVNTLYIAEYINYIKGNADLFYRVKLSDFQREVFCKRRAFALKENFLMNIRRGELYYADLSPVVGSEQGGVRPVLVVQNDVGNKYSPTVIAAAVTSKLNKAKLPTHIELPSSFGLAKDSVILLEQIRTIDKRRLKERIGELSAPTMRRVDKAILISLGFNVG